MNVNETNGQRLWREQRELSAEYARNGGTAAHKVLRQHERVDGITDADRREFNIDSRREDEGGSRVDRELAKDERTLEQLAAAEEAGR